jgi:signal transduction histidine kinase
VPVQRNLLALLALPWLLAPAAAEQALAGAHPAQAAAGWAWAFMLLALAAIGAVGWLAWRLGRLQATVAPAVAAAAPPIRCAGLAAANPAADGPEVSAAPVASADAAMALDLHHRPALLLDGTAGGVPRLLHLNAAARLLLPQARVGDILRLPPSREAGVQDPLAGLASALEGLPALQPGERTERAGWQLACTTAADGAGRRWGLLAEPPAAPDTETEQFSFTLSHDLRAPIRVVDGFTRIVKEDYGSLLDRVGNDHLDRVLGAASRMNLMIDAMLTLARLSRQPLTRQSVNLSQLATWVSEELRRGAPERQVQFEIEPGVQVSGDPTLLRLVLENLIGNAWKYSSGNALSVIRFGRVQTPGGPACCVQDNGAGFDMRGAERLFGLFQRLHSASEFPGTGVGLASVRRIVQRHGGHIWAEAEPGRGARFYFTLSGS